MATITWGSIALTNIFSQQDLTDIAAGTINVSNSTELKVTATDGVVYTFTGTGFGNVSNGVPHSGTITGITVVKSGSTALTETGLSVSVATVVNEITSDNADALNKTLYNHRDTFVGNNATGQIVFSGLGGNDTFDMRAVATGHGYNLYGGAGDDVLNLGASFSNAPGTIDGGTGNDLLILDGDYHANLNFESIANIETVKLEPGHNYTVQMLGGVTKGHTITIDGTKLGTGDVMSINGSGASIVTGHLVLEGGYGNDILGGGGHASDTITGNAGNDQLTGENGDVLSGGAGNDLLIAITGTLTLNGGSGADQMFGSTGDPELPDNAHVTFYYAKASDSTGANYDTITDFNGTRDHFSLPTQVTGIGATARAIDPNDIHAPTPDQLAASVGLSSHEAVVLTVKDLNHHVIGTFLVVDMNGVAGYQSGSDLLINISHPHSMSGLTTASFIDHGV